MRLESTKPQNESDFYANLHKRTFGRVFWKRVEPADESGFPDTYFVVQNTGMSAIEGIAELKYAETELPNMKALCRGNQKAALLEYSQAGGQRWFALCWCRGYVYLWCTKDFAASLRGDGRGWTAYKNMSDPDFALWLRGMLGA